MAEPILTATEVARLLKLNVETIYALIATHGLPAAGVSRRWCFEEAKVRAWFATQYQASITEQSGPV